MPHWDWPHSATPQMQFCWPHIFSSTVLMTAACLSIFWITQKRRCHYRRIHILIFNKRRMNSRSARWWDPRTWLAFAHWELRTIFNAYSNDGLSDLKAAAVIGMVEILAFGAV